MLFCSLLIILGVFVGVMIFYKRAIVISKIVIDIVGLIKVFIKVKDLWLFVEMGKIIKIIF